MVVTHHVIIAAALLLVCGVHADSRRLHHLTANDHSLFSTAKSVVELSSDKLDSFSSGSEKCPWIVLFYDSDCGHCRSFAPHYSAVADQKSTLNRPFLFASINCRAYDSVCRDRGIHAFPTVKGFVGGNWVDVQANTQAVQAFFKDYAFSSTIKARCTALWQYFQEVNAAKLRAAQNARGEEGEVITPVFNEITAFEQTDVANAFFSTMSHEVSMRPVDEASTEVLVSFLKVVHSAIPSLEADELLHYLEQKGSPLPIEAWKHRVENVGVPIKGGPGELTWLTCKGSSWQYRGYPCGMWLLYHSLLASIPSTEACAAVHTIQRYVKVFFLCSECREHFASLAIPFEATEKSTECYTKANLWLWNVHNDVNERLGKEQDDSDPKVPKVQFPTEEMCPECLDREHGDEGFNNAKVVEFLDKRYRWNVHNIVLGRKNTIEEDRRHLFEGTQIQRDEKHIERASLGMTIFCAFLVFGMAIYAMWTSLQRAKPMKQRPEYIASQARLMKQLGKSV